ncbi:SnoaL-like domain-containing protein [Lophiotrema nucula]|uniref:SnoaL-like domain-containing protein n=1 Tax=Lophiotrema nucula TaxID=690887 RepID=A0A6A5ZHP9_9PLEO|nr:SnoaL-like domain-containing protein [Lophiotrema nucula]
MSSEIEELKKLVAQLQKEVTRVSDQEEIRKLQYKYGYYLDKCLYQEVAELYSDHPDTCVEFLGGRYNGKDGVKRLYIGRFANAFTGRNGPVHGFLLDHPQIQGIVDVNPEGTRAKGRFRSMMAAGTHESIKDTHPRGLVQWWEGGIYENEYIKEDGIWKIFRLKYFPFWHATFEKGWSYTKPNYVPFLNTVYPEDPQGPNELLDNPMLWPDTRVVPFHYQHPITGVPVAEDDLRAPHFGQDLSTSAPALTLSKPKSEV